MAKKIPSCESWRCNLYTDIHSGIKSSNGVQPITGGLTMIGSQER